MDPYRDERLVTTITSLDTADALLSTDTLITLNRTIPTLAELLELRGNAFASVRDLLRHRFA